MYLRGNSVTQNTSLTENSSLENIDNTSSKSTVDSGTTSVFLDLPLLESAAGLTLTGVDSSGKPFSDDFQVGFPIIEETDFTYEIPFAPVEGSIEHSGTVTFGLGDGEVTLGDFSIGFDPGRVSDTASGFFVADTLDDALGLEVLFDVGVPATVSATPEELTIADADLLLAPEFADALSLSQLTGADVGDTRIDASAIAVEQEVEPKTVKVDSGTTSVFLDLPLLESAAGLTLTGVDSSGKPFSDDFQVGFPIIEETDFTYEIPFAPVEGSIEHSGTVTFGLGDGEVTLGDFSIGFDPGRVSDTASGFFVADTLDDALGLEVLFDVGVPATVSATPEELTIADADLLLAPEFADALSLSQLTGADVGDTRIDASAIAVDVIPDANAMSCLVTHH